MADALRRNSVLQLSALALLSLAIYVLAFVHPYSLFRWWREPARTIALVAGDDPAAARSYALAVVALFLLYALACWVASGRQRATAWLVAAIGTVAINAAMLCMYPVESVDVFDNVVRGRLQSLYGANPFFQVPMSFPRDPFLPYIAWPGAPSAYGPLWELIAAGTSRLAGDGVVANVLAFKLVSVLAYAASTSLIGLTLRIIAPDRALTGVLLYAWNPLVVYSTAGNGHNDAVMVLFVALGSYWLLRRRYTLAALAQTAGVLAKFVPALLVPVVLVTALRHQADWRERARYLLVTGAACALLVAAAYAPYWRDGAAIGDLLSLERRTKMFTTSLPTLLGVAVAPRLGEAGGQVLASRAALAALAAWTLWQLLRLWRRADGRAPIRAGASILLFYLLVACLWFQPWYVTWPLALVALLPDGALLRGTLLLSLSAMGKDPLLDFVVAPRRVLPPLGSRELQLTLGTLGAVWLYFACVALTTVVARARRQPRMESRPLDVDAPPTGPAPTVADEWEEGEDERRAA